MQSIHHCHCQAEHEQLIVSIVADTGMLLILLGRPTPVVMCLSNYALDQAHSPGVGPVIMAPRTLRPRTVRGVWARDSAATHVVPL